MKVRLLVVLACILGVQWQIGLAHGETVGERFRTAIEKIEKSCASRKLARGEVCGKVAKLKPADPLATDEGRFAHSIKIPNPIPADSGYKPGMTAEQYFDHLCKTEAGEFIYKTVENVEGLYMMRPREQASDYMQEHLYAMEDPYGYTDWEARDPQTIFVDPPWRIYSYLEAPLSPIPPPPRFRTHGIVAIQAMCKINRQWLKIMYRSSRVGTVIHGVAFCGHMIANWASQEAS